MFSRQAALEKRALAIIDSVNPPATEPRTLEDSLQSDCGKECARAWDAEVVHRYTSELNKLDIPRQTAQRHPIALCRELPVENKSVQKFRKHKVRCEIRGDIIRPGIDFDDTHTASHMPSQAGR